MTTERILEWSKERIIVLADEVKAHYQRPMTGDLEYNFREQMVCFTNTQLRDFYKLAHQDGQRAMRERAAKVGRSYEPRCDSCPSGIENAIRNLEIEGEPNSLTRSLRPTNGPKDISDIGFDREEQTPNEPPCNHMFVTTFGGDYCAFCNEPAESNNYPATPEEELNGKP